MPSEPTGNTPERMKSESFSAAQVPFRRNHKGRTHSGIAFLGSDLLSKKMKKKRELASTLKIAAARGPTKLTRLRCSFKRMAAAQRERTLERKTGRGSARASLCLCLPVLYLSREQTRPTV